MQEDPVALRRSVVADGAALLDELEREIATGEAEHVELKRLVLLAAAMATSP